MGLLDAVNDFISPRRKQAALRTQEMEALARHMGWPFLPIGVISFFIPDYGYFRLFSVGDRIRKISNILYHDGDQLRVAIFNYELVTRLEPEESKIYAQTVFYYLSPKLALPASNFRRSTRGAP